MRKIVTTLISLFVIVGFGCSVTSAELTSAAANVTNKEIVVVIHGLVVHAESYVINSVSIYNA